VRVFIPTRTLRNTPAFDGMAVGCLATFVAARGCSKPRARV